jgi:hypothetical protein
MPPRTIKRAPLSGLAGRTWTFPGIGKISLADSDPDHWDAVDRQWPPVRAPHQLNDHWKWKSIMFGKPERYSVLNPTGDVLGLWASGALRPLNLFGVKHYRLDFFEVSPIMRGGTLSVAVFSLICARAVELGCQGLVLAALPGVERFYLTIGGTQELARGWKADSCLVPFLFAEKTLNSLAEHADDHLDEG